MRTYSRAVNGYSRVTGLRKDPIAVPAVYKPRDESGSRRGFLWSLTFLEYRSCWENIPWLRRCALVAKPYIGGDRVIETTFEQADSLQEVS